MTWYLMKSRSVTYDDMGTICDNKQYLTRMPNDTHAQVTELPFVYDTDRMIQNKQVIIANKQNIFGKSTTNPNEHSIANPSGELACHT